MKVLVSSDHAGVELKNLIVKNLKELGFEVLNLGTDSSDSVDYPDFADKVCSQVNESSELMGVLICGSGQGMAMRANKFQNIRAALCWSTEAAKLARNHNNANILCLGSRLTEQTTNLEILKVFFTEKFEGGRHQNRVAKLNSSAL